MVVTIIGSLKQEAEIALATDFARNVLKADEVYSPVENNIIVRPLIYIYRRIIFSILKRRIW